MKKQTAVEFLFKQIYGDTGHIGSFTTEGKDAYEAFQQVIQMEKENMIGLLQWMNKINSETPMRLETDLDDIVEQYYNETYKGGEQ